MRAFEVTHVFAAIKVIAMRAVKLEPVIQIAGYSESLERLNDDYKKNVAK